MLDVDSLYQLMMAKFEAQEKATNIALNAADKAVTKAEIAHEKRLDSVNEFRQTLADQTSTFIPRNEAHVQFQRLEDKIEKIISEKRAMMLSLIILGAGVIVNLVVQFVVNGGQ